MSVEQSPAGSLSEGDTGSALCCRLLWACGDTGAQFGLASPPAPAGRAGLPVGEGLGRRIRLLLSPLGAHRGLEPLCWGPPVLAEPFPCLQALELHPSPRAELPRCSLPAPGGFIQQKALSLPWCAPGGWLGSAQCPGCSLPTALIFSWALVPGCAAALRRSTGSASSVDKTPPLGISLFEALFPVFPMFPCASSGWCRVSWPSSQSLPSLLAALGVLHSH